jgi:hypothetical protein
MLYIRTRSRGRGLICCLANLLVCGFVVVSHLNTIFSLFSFLLFLVCDILDSTDYAAVAASFVRMFFSLFHPPYFWFRSPLIHWSWLSLHSWSISLGLLYVWRNFRALHISVCIGLIGSFLWGCMQYYYNRHYLRVSVHSPKNKSRNGNEARSIRIEHVCIQRRITRSRCYWDRKMDLYAVKVSKACEEYKNDTDIHEVRWRRGEDRRLNGRKL